MRAVSIIVAQVFGQYLNLIIRKDKFHAIKIATNYIKYFSLFFSFDNFFLVIRGYIKSRLALVFFFFFKCD